VIETKGLIPNCSYIIKALTKEDCIMRVIETEMLEAIKHGKDWSKDNTRVESVQSTGGADVFLHGHHIATVQRDGLALVIVNTLRQWPTRTTMSRLRALGVDVCTRKGVVLLNDQPI
jgi:hypothetical protein